MDSPNGRAPSLSQRVVEGVTERIRGGVLKPGERVPTEPELMREFGVSRSVVREAVSRLQANGLVRTRQGVGSFVLAVEPDAALLQPPDLALKLQQKLAMLELRLSLESDAAALAAQRRTPQQLTAMERALQDYEAQLRKSSFSDPVLDIPNDFESKLAKGEAPEVVIVSDSGNRNASVGVGRIRATLRGFSEERTTLELASRGIARTSLKVLDIEEHNLANASARCAQLTNMLPFFLILAILYGALNAALDTTAGERERGSLEPLLTNPASAWSIVLGKWGAVATVGVMIAILSALSFFPGQWLLQSETLQAMFQYGAREAVLFIIVLIPLAASMSALLMAVAIRCKTFKEAQASNTIVILAFSLLPMFSLMNSTGEKAWHLALPGLAQNIVMNRILKNEPLDALTLGLPPLVALVITVVCLTFVARSLKAAAVK